MYERGRDYHMWKSYIASVSLTDWCILIFINKKQNNIGSLYYSYPSANIRSLYFSSNSKIFTFTTSGSNMPSMGRTYIHLVHCRLSKTAPAVRTDGLVGLNGVLPLLAFGLTSFGNLAWEAHCYHTQGMLKGLPMAPWYPGIYFGSLNLEIAWNFV